MKCLVIILGILLIIALLFIIISVKIIADLTHFTKTIMSGYEELF